MFTRRNTIFIRTLLSWAVITALGTSVGHATVLRKLSLEELVSNADTIVLGKCEKAEAIWLNRRIYTVATVRVQEPVKGKLLKGNALKIYILGGRVRKPMPVKMHVPGAARVVQGEEMVLFLKAGGAKKQHHRFVGMFQGKMTVETDAKTGEKVVRHAHPVKGVKMVGREGKLLPQSTDAKQPEPGNLETFLNQLKGIMARQEARLKEASKQKGESENVTQKRKGGEK